MAKPEMWEGMMQIASTWMSRMAMAKPEMWGDVDDEDYFDFDVDDQAGAAPQRERTAAPPGLQRGAPAWIQWMHSLRWGRHRSGLVDDSETGLETPIRHGDQSAGNSEDARPGYSERSHSDEMLPEGVLNIAFQQICKGGTNRFHQTDGSGETDIGQTLHAKDLLVVVTSACKNCLREVAAAVMASLTSCAAAHPQAINK